MAEADPDQTKSNHNRQVKAGQQDRSKRDPEARAEQKRRVRAERQRREEAGDAASAQHDADATPVASRLHRIEKTLSTQIELTEELLRRVKSLVAINDEARKRD